MKITFLGTGAAEAFPALFCNCENCQRARKLGGRNLRCRSSALVNDDLLIDYGPDTSAQCTRFNVDLTKVKDILITHSHADHLYMHDVRHRKVTSRLKGSLGIVRLWGNKTSIETFNEQTRVVFMEELNQGGKHAVRPTDEEVIEEIEDFFFVKTIVIEPHQTINLGRYKVYTIHAHHKEPELSLNFVIDDGTTRFLYGTDTGLWDEEEWNYIESLGAKLDVIALDCTVGLGRTGGHHSNESFLKTKNEFVTRDLLSERCTFFAHHFSHQSNVTYDDIVELMKPHSVEITFDGLVVEK